MITVSRSVTARRNGSTNAAESPRRYAGLDPEASGHAHHPLTLEEGRPQRP